MRYFRLVALTFLELLLDLPLHLTASRPPIAPQVSWANTHGDFFEIGQVPAIFCRSHTCRRRSSWAGVICAGVHHVVRLRRQATQEPPSCVLSSCEAVRRHTSPRRRVPLSQPPPPVNETQPQAQPLCSRRQVLPQLLPVHAHQTAPRLTPDGLRHQHRHALNGEGPWVRVYPALPPLRVPLPRCHRTTVHTTSRWGYVAYPSSSSSPHPETETETDLVSERRRRQCTTSARDDVVIAASASTLCPYLDALTRAFSIPFHHCFLCFTAISLTPAHTFLRMTTTYLDRIPSYDTIHFDASSIALACSQLYR
ncbi:putative pheromone receptor [Mycena venus]|uniref:Putative pheromone receptor n=1 Tax=Mycena venus TaxID=2733690 RepID=A0A8H6XEQ4_9AGAR|nr:putative pheromone receptor [Mycena venus]